MEPANERLIPLKILPRDYAATKELIEERGYSENLETTRRGVDWAYVWAEVK